MAPNIIDFMWSTRRRSRPSQDSFGNTIIPFVSGHALMRDRNRQAMVARIARLVSLPKAHFDLLYISTLERFAEYVQQLPASEAHHHASLGGLLNHSLDVIEKALALRRGHLLPENADPGVVSRQADLWTYAVFTAALCHDVGKAVVDQAVERFDRKSKSLGPWNPWLGPMRDTAFYRVTFVRDRDYSRHELVAPFVARLIVHEKGIEWLGSDRQVMSACLAALSGNAELAGALSLIVSQADSLSTSENLGAVGETRLPAAHVKPLREKLVTALRHLLDAGDLPLNRPGAAGFTTETDLWLVSKRCLDAIRAHLIDQGHSGIPSKNDRLMDDLQQFGLCMPNGDRAIWKARVQCADFDHALTMLRFRVDRIWPDPAARPTPLDGSITPEGDSQGPDTAPIPSAPVSRTESAATEFVLPPIAEPEVVEALDAKASDSNRANRGTETPRNPRTGPKSPEQRQDSAATPAPNDSPEPDGFLQWLRQGLTIGSFEVNTTDAVFHSVREGLLMVSPRVFKKYAGTDKNWSYVQMRFFKAALHRRNREKTNIIRYKVEGNRKTSQLKGVLIPEPENALGVVLPEPNRHLALITDLQSEITVPTSL